MAPEFTAARLCEMLHYDPKTGTGTWLERRKGRRRIAGCVYTRADGKQYRVICIDYVLYGAHQLFWYYMTGVWPPDEVDHINGDGTDNRWVNLRLATSAQQNQNKGPRSDNTSGFTGAFWVKSKNRWRALIRNKHLGYFATAEEAHEAYRKAAIELYGEFTHERLRSVRRR